MLKLTPSIPTKRHLRFRYAKYADGWILITNAPKHIVDKLKEKYSQFLQKELSATLSEEKTLIMDFRKIPTLPLPRRGRGRGRGRGWGRGRGGV